MKGRAIWGGLVPYAEVWRTGANEATTITFSDPVTVNGNALAAGTYGLFTIPGKESWTVILNKGAKLWGAYEYKKEEDVLRFEVKPRVAAAPKEWMQFRFEALTNDSAEVVLAWESVEVPFTVKVEVTERVLTAARKAIAEAKADDWRTPYRAAAFCIETGVNLDEAATWLDKSVTIKPGYYNTLAKAKLLAAKGKKAEAITARQEGDRAGSRRRAQGRRGPGPEVDRGLEVGSSPGAGLEPSVHDRTAGLQARSLPYSNPMRPPRPPVRGWSPALHKRTAGLQARSLLHSNPMRPPRPPMRGWSPALHDRTVVHDRTAGLQARSLSYPSTTRLHEGLFARAHATLSA